MANILNIKPEELAIKINKMEKQERYQQLKGFYLKEYPRTKEFYDHYKSRKQEVQSQYYPCSDVENDLYEEASIRDATKEENATTLIIKNGLNDENYKSKTLNSIKNNNFDIDDEKNNNKPSNSKNKSIDYDKLMDDLFN